MDAQTKQLVFQTINRLEETIRTLKSLIGIQPTPSSPTSTPPKQKPSKLPQEPGFGPKDSKKGPKFFATSLSADHLGPTPDFKSDDWPIAIDPSMIVPIEGDTEKQYRALQIIGLMGMPLEGKVVLDCGCGEGYNAREMANTATQVVAYDIKNDEHWPGRNKENLFFACEKKLVEERAPYDFIVLYDVIDHLRGEDPESFMQWVSSLLKGDGCIFVRTHPWTAATGGHYYESANKAWIHLALTPDELVQAGLTSTESNLRIVRPMAAYELWFKNAGLVIDTKQAKSSEVDAFFLNDGLIDRIIKVTWGGAIDIATAKKIMTNHWVDYVLKK